MYDDAETKSMSASTLGRRAELFELRRGTETKEDSKQNDRAEEHNQKAYLKYTKVEIKNPAAETTAPIMVAVLIPRILASREAKGPTS